VLGGVCHESDRVRRRGGACCEGVAAVGAVRRRGRAGVRSMRRRGVSFTTLVNGSAEVLVFGVGGGVLDDFPARPWISLHNPPNTAAGCRNGV